MTDFAAHPWNVSPAEAIRIQERLKDQVVTEDALGPVATLGGVDVGFEDGGRTTRAAVVVMSYPGLAPLEHAIARSPTHFPYVPGLLSFREIPAVLEAFGQLSARPDLLLCDGQGIAHPRRLGIASHLGLVLDIPAIGVAKSRLVGRFDPPGPDKGDWSPLTHRGERIGAVLRTRVNVKPLFISSGHRVSLDSALRYTLDATTRYRLPETTRWADRLASRR